MSGSNSSSGTRVSVNMFVNNTAMAFDQICPIIRDKVGKQKSVIRSGLKLKFETKCYLETKLSCLLMTKVEICVVDNVRQKLITSMNFLVEIDQRQCGKIWNLYYHLLGEIITSQFILVVRYF